MFILLLVDFYNYCEFIMLVVNDLYYWKNGYWIEIDDDGRISRGMVILILV